MQLSLLALVIASSFAPGTMPRLSADGTLTVEICTGEGVRTIAMCADGTVAPEDPQGDPAGHDLPSCAWAALHSLSITDGGTAPVLTFVAEVAGQILFPAPPSVLPRARTSSTFIRGPPVFL